MHHAYSVACEAVILPLFVKLSNYMSTRSRLSSSLLGAVDCIGPHGALAGCAAAHDLLPAGSANLLDCYDDALIRGGGVRQQERSRSRDRAAEDLGDVAVIRVPHMVEEGGMTDVHGAESADLPLDDNSDHDTESTCDDTVGAALSSRGSHPWEIAAEQRVRMKNLSTDGAADASGEGACRDALRCDVAGTRAQDGAKFGDHVATAAPNGMLAAEASIRSTTTSLRDLAILSSSKWTRGRASSFARARPGARAFESPLAACGMRALLAAGRRCASHSNSLSNDEDCLPMRCESPLAAA